MDRIQLVAVVSALVLDVIVLGTMIARIGELGFTPNRTAALGLNVLLLVSLAGTAWLSARFLTGHGASTGSSLADHLSAHLWRLGRCCRGCSASALLVQLTDKHILTSWLPCGSIYLRLLCI